MNCQRIDSMLAVNDLLIYKLVIFEGDGGKDDYGEETGKLVSKYQKIPKILVMYPNNSSANYPFNQTELNQYLREAGYDNFSVKSAYSVSDTMYFEEPQRHSYIQHFQKRQQT